MLVIIQEPDEPIQVFRNVGHSGQLPDWSWQALVCCIKGHGQLIWYRDKKDVELAEKRMRELTGELLYGTSSSSERTG